MIKVTPEELEILQEERRRANRDLRALGLSDGRLNEVEAKHFGGSLRVARRDKDGSIIATVSYRSHPAFARYVRKLRVVPRGSVGQRTCPLARRGLTTVS